MFQNLKVGSLVYILETKDNPKYYTATIKDMSTPFYPQPKPGQFNPFQQQYINITVDGTTPWTVPVNATSANRDGIAVATNPEALLSFLTTAQQESSNIVNSYEKHKNNLVAYEQIRNEIDPASAKSKEQERQILQLNEKISQLEKVLGNIPTKRDLMDLLSSKETSSKTAK